MLAGMSTPSKTEQEITGEVLEVLGLGARYSAALHALHETIRTPAVEAELARAEHAAAYEQTAGVYRRRAAADKVAPDERVELERRAAYYEARARVKRAGAVMPPELRTPAERLEAVDRVRAALLRLLASIGDVSGEELEAFESALLDQKNELPPRAGSSSDQFLFLKSIVQGVLVRMGCLFDETGRGVRVLPWAIDIAQAGGVSFKPAEAAAPAPAPAPAPPAPAAPAPAAEALPASPAAVEGPSEAADVALVNGRPVSVPGAVTFTPGPGPNADPHRVTFTPGPNGAGDGTKAP